MTTEPLGHDHLLIPLGEATDAQLLRALYARQTVLLEHVTGMEQTMADLQQSVAELKTAVQGVADRVGPRFDELTASLAAARQAYTDLVAAEDAEDVAQTTELQAARDALSAALTDAETAAGDISGEVAKLNAIAPAEAPPA